MIESFVDLTYRGLSLGRRVKLSHVRPSTGYLETPAPMPVGTSIQISTDEGVSIEAKVTAIHEQTGGSDKPPGMTVAPSLAGEALESWWRARVAYPDEDIARPRTTSSPIVRPRNTTQVDDVPPIPVAQVARIAANPDPAGGKTVAMMAVLPPIVDSHSAPPSAVLRGPAEPGLVDDAGGDGGKATMIMPAVDQELLEQLTRGSGEIDKLVRSTGEHEVVDDGKMTTVMEAIDPAALGLDAGNSGSFAAASDEETDPGASGPVSTNGNGDKKNGGGKKKRKRR